MSRRQLPGTREFSQRVQRAFGQRLREARLRLPETSQLQVAQALGITRASVSNIEHGRQRVFLDQVYAAASLLNVPVHTLLPDEIEILHRESVHISTVNVDRNDIQKLIEAADKAVKMAAKTSKTSGRKVRNNAR